MVRVFKFLFLVLFVSFGSYANNLEYCQDEAAKYFREVVKNDKSNILAKQYELTTLKLARATAKESRSTLEEYIKKASKSINPNDPALKELDELYSRHGHKEDLKKIVENFSSKNHWNKNTRIYNDDVSSFILMASKVQPELNLNKRDAAITWFMNSISNQANDIYGKGSAFSNKLNLSNRLAKYTGAIAGKRSLTDSEFAKKISKLQDDLNKEIKNIHQTFLIEFHAECFDGALFAGSCLHTKNETNALFSNALNDLALEINQQELLGLTSDVIKIKGKYNIDLIDLPTWYEYRKETPLNLIPPKLDYDSIADIRIHDHHWVNQRDVKRLEDNLNFLSDEWKIKAFHEHATSETYAILDKEKGIVKVYNKDGAVIEYAKVGLTGMLGDEKNLGGAGNYHIHSIKNGVVFIQDDRGNVRPLEGVRLDKLKSEVPFYILPKNKDHHFVIRNGKINFTTKGKKADYAPYNFSKKDTEIKKIKTVIKKKEYQTATAITFMNEIDAKKAQLTKMYGLTNHEYNELTKLAFGILGNESQFGESKKYWIKEAMPFAVSMAKGNGLDTSSNSRGPTQIKTVPKKIARRYGVTKDSLEKPRHAALATMGFLADALSELKAKEKHHPAITPENRFNYLHYIYMGKSHEITKGTATPNRNIYYRQIRNYNKGLEVYEKID
jgi:hypothetical protein